MQEIVLFITAENALPLDPFLTSVGSSPTTNDSFQPANPVESFGGLKDVIERGKTSGREPNDVREISKSDHEQQKRETVRS